MSGVFGAYAQGDGPAIDQLLAHMGQAMCHREWNRVEMASCSPTQVGIGRIDIGIFNSQSQPLRNSDNSLLLTMAGEFYSVDGQEPEGVRRHENLALELFETYGSDLVAHVKGAFVIAVIDETQKKIWVLNDRHGQYPLYYAHYGNTFAFAPEMSGILADPSFPRDLDQIALLQFLRLQAVLGERTYFQGMKYLRQASCLEFNWASNELKVKSYWDFSHVEENPVDFEEAVDTAGRLLLQGVERMTDGTLRLGVYLSGGLDSRTLASMARTLGYPITTITYGEPGCRDEILARRIARRIGSDHHYFPFLDGQWVEQYSELHMDLTEGYHGWNHSHSISTLAAARTLIDVNLTGWNGGEVLHPGSAIEDWCVHPQSIESLTARFFELAITRWQWPGLTEGEAAALLTPSLANRASHLVFDSLREEVRKLEGARSEMQAYFFILEHLSRRWTFNILTMLRSHIEVRSPYLDYDFFDFVASLPRDHFLDRRLHRGVITRFAPKVSWVPECHERLLPTTRERIRKLHSLGFRAIYRFNKHIWPMFTEPPALYADYENYLRTDLRPWAESILDDPRLEERELFNVEYVRLLFDRHCAGYDEWTLGKIAPVINLELMLRRFFD